MEAAIEFVGADLCVGPGTVSRGRHHGRTHRSAPTRGGERLGTNGNWRGTMPFPAGRDGARPLQRAEQPGGGVWSPRPTGATLVVPSGGPMWASAPTKRRESCIDHPGQRRRASVCGADGRKGRGLRQRSSPKGPATSDNPSVSLRLTAPFAQGSLWDGTPGRRALWVVLRGKFAWAKILVGFSCSGGQNIPEKPCNPRKSMISLHRKLE